MYVSGLLISWAIVAESVPIDARRSVRTRCSCAVTRSVTSMDTPMAPSTSPVAPRIGVRVVSNQVRALLTDDREGLAREHPAGLGDQRLVVCVEIEDRTTEELLGAKSKAVEAAPFGERHDPAPIVREENDGSVREEVVQVAFGQVGARSRP